jgi:hypothetical protein
VGTVNKDKGIRENNRAASDQSTATAEPRRHQNVQTERAKREMEREVKRRDKATGNNHIRQKMIHENQRNHNGDVKSRTK